jgi:uncharacterized protein YndB with AHSA1/START domain
MSASGKLPAAMLMLAIAPMLMASEIESLTVERTDNRINVDSVMHIAAPPELVFAALSDYGQFDELSSRYKQSRFIEPAADGTPRIFTEVEGCVWFFCRSVQRTSRLDLQPNERIVATAEPDESDVSYGREEWVLSAEAGGTRVDYTHVMEPDFWIPPLIGVWAIRRSLEGDALSAAQRIEVLALSQGESGSADAANSD